MPDYQAQDLTRMLFQSKLHSDVGVESYFETSFNFNFEGSMPSFLIQRVYMFSSAGLLQWWSHFIIRTYLVRKRESEPPAKPTLSGNIQIIFFMLIYEMSIALVSMIVELHLYINRAIYRSILSAPMWIVGMVKTIMCGRLRKKEYIIWGKKLEIRI